MTMNLKRISFFSHLTQKEIEKLEQCSSFKNYETGDIVFYEKEKSKYLYILLKGSIDLYKTNLKGKQLYINTIKDVGFLGDFAIFQNRYYLCTAECKATSKILKIECINAKQKSFLYDIFCKNLTQSAYKTISVLIDMIDNSFLTSKEKVAKQILQNTDIFEDMTYSNIAKKMGMSPENLSRILSEFKKDKLITIDKNHKITILSKDNIKRICE